MEKTNEIKTTKLPANSPNIKPESNAWIYITIAIIVGAVALIIFFGMEEPTILADEDTAVCLAEESELYASASCGFCNQQKEILGEYYNLFNVTYCEDNREVCSAKDIGVVPTWVIKGEKYGGVKTLEKLKELADC